MKKAFTLLLILPLLCVGCSSNDKTEEPEVKNEYNVELSDLYGTWIVNESTQANLVGVKLVLDRSESCTWDDMYGNGYVGPYYFWENVNDESLHNIGTKLSVANLDRIHIDSAKVLYYTAGQRAILSLNCDLYPFIADHKWVDFDEKIDYHEWSFWRFNTFRYDFDIVKYSADRLELLLESSDIRYCDYPERYPFRIADNTKILLIRQ